MNKVMALKMIETYVGFKRQAKEIEEALSQNTPRFYEACEFLGQDSIELNHGKVMKSKTAGVYQFPQKIVKLEDEVKLLKDKWKEKHEPVGGGQTIWKVQVKD